MFYTLAGILVLNFPREFPDLISLGRSSVPLYVLLLLLIFIFVYIKIREGSRYQIGRIFGKNPNGL